MAVAVVVAVVVAVDDLVVVVVGIVAAVLETDVAAAVVPPSDNPDIHCYSTVLLISLEQRTTACLVNRVARQRHSKKRCESQLISHEP